MTDVPAKLMIQVLDTLERVECQYWACDGPTLEPVAMVTCHRCATLALVRVTFGEPPRRADEMTAEEAMEARHAATMREDTMRDDGSSVIIRMTL